MEKYIMYNIDAKCHTRKEEANNYVIQNYLKDYIANRAIIMPSVTWQVEAMYVAEGIFNSSTQFLAIERGFKEMNVIKYRDACNKKCNELLGVDFNYDKYIKCARGIIYGKSLHEIYMNYDVIEEVKFDFANFDTCSTVLHLNEWIPHFIKIIKDSSPVLFTFDLDGTNRQKNKDFSFLDKNDFSIFDCEFKSFGNIKNKNISDKILTIKGYLDSVGVQIKFVGVYKETNSTYTMGVFYGIKK